MFQQNDALQGGGITILSVEFGAHDVLITNSAFHENTGYTQAGGLLVMLASALVTCRNTTFTHNHSPDGAAIAQVFLQATMQTSTLRLAGCLILQNGGAEHSVTATITRLGGAIYQQCSEGCIMVLQNTSVNGNQAFSGAGVHSRL